MIDESPVGRTTVVVSSGRHIVCEVHGTSTVSPPVLLVRPLGGTSALWGTFRTELAKHHRVASFDLPGTGASTRGATLFDTTESLAHDCVRVLDHLRFERAHVFGISLGGMIASWLAYLAPERVSRLCLASTPQRGIEVTHLGVRRALSIARCFLRSVSEVEPCLVRHILSARFRAEQPHEVASIDRIVRERPSKRSVLLAHVLAGARHDARAFLPRIDHEALILAGDEDELLPAAHVRTLASRLPRAAFELVREAGHDLSLERPRETATRAAEFFSS